MPELRAILMNCSLKPLNDDEKSSTDAMLKKVMAILEKKDVACKLYRMVDQNIEFGVEADMGDGDGWPPIRREILASDIIVIGTPIWLGHRASVCQMVLERMDAFLSETNDKGQLPLYNKVAGVCVVGNEDGAQRVAEGVVYNLMQLGATIPPNAEAYWVGEAGGSVDYVDGGQKSEYTKKLINYVAHNLVHMARILKDNPIPAEGNNPD